MLGKLTVTIEMRTDNAAFEPDRQAEIVRLLVGVPEFVSRVRSQDDCKLYDYNGNCVGTVKVHRTP